MIRDFYIFIQWSKFDLLPSKNCINITLYHVKLQDEYVENVSGSRAEKCVSVWLFDLVLSSLQEDTNPLLTKMRAGVPREIIHLNRSSLFQELW